MIKSKLFIRFALLGILVSGFFLALSILTTNWMRNLIFDEPFRDRGPFRAFELLLDKISAEQRVDALRGLRADAPHPGGSAQRPPPPPPSSFDSNQEARPGGAPPISGGMMGPTVEMVLLDADGELIFPESLDPEKLNHVAELIERLKSGSESRVLGENFAVRRLSGEPAQYFARALRLRPPPPPFGTILFLSSIQLASIIAAVLVTLAVVLFSLRTRARQADAVMKELSAGNLKARLQITKMDEVGQTMFSFNKMADEIERLIEHLRKTENARKDLLRELAHDLRTPVASLKSLIETVSVRADQLPKEKLRELLDLAMKEADYFEGLVDDLLFLGRVGEPKYKTNIENFDLSDLVSLEIDSIATRYPDIDVSLESSGDVVVYDGDPSLIKRLVRNAIENAASFARSKIVFQLSDADDGLIMRVSDDGPGFDSTSLASFGQRKYSRAMTEVGGTKRISIGLGSVIMKSITDAHRGELVAANRMSAQGDVLGAEVTMRLPRS